MKTFALFVLFFVAVINGIHGQPNEEHSNTDASLRLPHQGNPLLRIKRFAKCEPGTSRQLDCNTCFCNESGTGEMCTLMACLGPVRHRREVPFSCVPGSYWNMDCNGCSCTEDGRNAMCTMMACPPK